MALNYVVLSGTVLALLTVVMLAWRRSASMPAWRPVLLAMAGVVVLTAVFDPVLVRLHLIAYDYSKTLGITLLGAPIEDFAYAIAAGLLIPHVWERFGRD